MTQSNHRRPRSPKHHNHNKHIENGNNSVTDKRHKDKEKKWWKLFFQKLGLLVFETTQKISKKIICC